MNKKEARILFMDYIYGEIDKNQRSKLEKHLDEHPELRDELAELQETSNIIRKIPVEEPAHRLIVVDPKDKGFSQWYRDAKVILMPKTVLAKTVLGLAAMLLIVFLFASFARFQVTSTDNGWTVAFGSAPAVIQQGVDEDVINELISQMQQENLLLISTLMEESQQQNEEQLQEAVGAILEYMQEQRRMDLQLVGRGLAEIEEENYYRYLQTNETLGELIYAIHQQ